MDSPKPVLLAPKIQWFIESDFRQENWCEGIGRFDCIATNQTVHELRHKRHARQLHSQVRGTLNSKGLYLVCDHFVGDGGMQNTELFMSVEEQQQALLAAGLPESKKFLLRAVSSSTGQPNRTIEPIGGGIGELVPWGRRPTAGILVRVIA
jgi:hypothetical protein